MKITWNTEVNAPCCPGEIVAEDGRSILIQTDYDYPGVARSFGWDMREVQVQNAGYYGVRCEHDGTDGTVTCPDCGLTATTFISAAHDWLRDNGGLSTDDPGYFSEE